MHNINYLIKYEEERKSTARRKPLNLLGSATLSAWQLRRDRHDLRPQRQAPEP